MLQRKHFAAFAALQFFGSYRTNNGHHRTLVRRGSVAIDPLRTWSTFAYRNLWNIGVRSASFRPDVGLTNNAAIVVVLFTKLSGKIGAAHTDRMKVKGG